MSALGIRDNRLIVKKLSFQDSEGEPNCAITYNIPKCASAISTGAILSGYELGDIGTADIGYGDTSTFAAQPPYALNLVLIANGTEIGHSLGGGLSDSDPFIIKGYDAMGNHIQETLYVPTVSDATTSTKKAFAWINTVSQRTGTVSSSSDIGLSWGDKIGLPYPITTTDDIIAFTRNTAGATTMPDITTAGYNTMQPLVMDDADSMTIVYKTKLDLGN